MRSREPIQGPQRLEMAGEKGLGEVIDTLTAALASASGALAMAFGVIAAALDNRT
jgi:hypothetical protein